MKKIRIIQILFLAVGLFCYASCGEDDPCDSHVATYDGDVKAIVNSSCSFSGCHSGAATGSAYIGNADAIDFTSYAGMKAAVEDGRFNARVLADGADMPPDPLTLTPAQIEILTCWKDAGFPEN